MDEAQYLADRVAVIAAGRIAAEGTPATLAGRDTGRARIRRAHLRSLPLRFPSGADAAPAIVNAAILPLLFLSGIFIPFIPPGGKRTLWILWIAGLVIAITHFS